MVVHGDTQCKNGKVHQIQSWGIWMKTRISVIIIVSFDTFSSYSNFIDVLHSLYLWKLYFQMISVNYFQSLVLFTGFITVFGDFFVRCIIQMESDSHQLGCIKDYWNRWWYRRYFKDWNWIQYLGANINVNELGIWWII